MLFYIIYDDDTMYNIMYVLYHHTLCIYIIYMFCCIYISYICIIYVYICLCVVVLAVVCYIYVSYLYLCFPYAQQTFVFLLY